MHTELDVRHVAHLARIELTDEEAATYGRQLGRVLEYVNQLREADLTGVEPTAHANAVDNVFRADVPSESLLHEAALENAPKQANGLILITKVIE